MRLYIAIFLVIAAITAGAFWHFFGRSLHYDVYASDIEWYSEEFSLKARIGVTAFVAATPAHP